MPTAGSECRLLSPALPSGEMVRGNTEPDWARSGVTG
jgi:hypothetical protein